MVKEICAEEFKYLTLKLILGDRGDGRAEGRGGRSAEACRGVGGKVQRDAETDVSAGGRNALWQEELHNGL